MAFFFGAMMFSSVSVQATEPVPKWVCCQTWKISECVDRFGWPYNGTEKVEADFCS